MYALAEKFLKSVEVNQNYPLLLLHLVDKSEINITIRIAGAVAFKNYVKRNWKVVIIYVVYTLTFIILLSPVYIYSVYNITMLQLHPGRRFCGSYTRAR